MRRSAIDQEDLKPYWKLEKDHICLGDQQSYYLSLETLTSIITTGLPDPNADCFSHLTAFWCEKIGTQKIKKQVFFPRKVLSFKVSFALLHCSHIPSNLNMVFLLILC